MPRSTPLEAKAREDLLSALRAGNSREAAARYAGLAPAELTARLTSSATLARDVLAAEASAEVSHVASIALAAKKDWRAASFLLERAGKPGATGMCGAKSKRTGAPCRHARGFRTNHAGAGNCYLHGGRTPNGETHAARELAAAAVARLGMPAGTGDPFGLLTKAIRYAEGFLEATGRAVVEADNEELREAAATLHAEAIRTASRTGKAAVDADVADRMAALDERAGELLMRFVRELLERVVPAAERPAIEAWASARLGQLATEYEQAAVVH